LKMFFSFPLFVETPLPPRARLWLLLVFRVVFFRVSLRGRPDQLLDRNLPLRGGRIFDFYLDFYGPFFLSRFFLGRSFALRAVLSSLLLVWGSESGEAFYGRCLFLGCRRLRARTAGIFFPPPPRPGPFPHLSFFRGVLVDIFLRSSAVNVLLFFSLEFLSPLVSIGVVPISLSRSKLYCLSPFLPPTGPPPDLNPPPLFFYLTVFFFPWTLRLILLFFLPRVSLCSCFF